MKNFYNKSLFPNYELSRFNSKDDLISSASKFTKILDRSIPGAASVIDVGTGTGQLSALLSLRRKCVYGIDFSESSLRKALSLKKRLNLGSWHLKKVDITDKKQVNKINMKFDYVLCLGVLHHTQDPYQSFKNLLKLLKPEGHICIGLYNKLARLPLKIRKILYNRVFRNNEKIKDRFIKMQIGGIDDEERREGWWNDQYKHPHETTHSLGQVLNWLKKNHIEYYQTIPSSVIFDQDDINFNGLWNKKSYPYFPIRICKQLTWVWKIHDQGGYWITFGKMKAN